MPELRGIGFGFGDGADADLRGIGFGGGADAIARYWMPLSRLALAICAVLGLAGVPISNSD